MNRYNVEDISAPLNVRFCTLSGVEGYDEDITTPLNVRGRSLSWFLSLVELEPK